MKIEHLIFWCIPDNIQELLQQAMWNLKCEFGDCHWCQCHGIFFWIYFQFICVCRLRLYVVSLSVLLNTNSILSEHDAHIIVSRATTCHWLGYALILHAPAAFIIAFVWRYYLKLDRRSDRRTTELSGCQSNQIVNLKQDVLPKQNTGKTIGEGTSQVRRANHVPSTFTS